MQLALLRVLATDLGSLTKGFHQLTLTLVSKLRWLINWWNLYYKAYSALCNLPVLKGLFSSTIARQSKDRLIRLFFRLLSTNAEITTTESAEYRSFYSLGIYSPSLFQKETGYHHSKSLHLLFCVSSIT